MHPTTFLPRRTGPSAEEVKGQNSECSALCAVRNRLCADRITRGKHLISIMLPVACIGWWCVMVMTRAQKD
jgi:hypothetical protein